MKKDVIDMEEAVENELALTKRGLRNHWKPLLAILLTVVFLAMFLSLRSAHNNQKELQQQLEQQNQQLERQNDLIEALKGKKLKAIQARLCLLSPVRR